MTDLSWLEKESCAVIIHKHGKFLSANLTKLAKLIIFDPRIVM